MDRDLLACESLPAHRCPSRGGGLRLSTWPLTARR